MDEFETLLASSRTAVDRWLKAHMGNCTDAEDVLQDICLAAFQGFTGLQNKASFAIVFGILNLGGCLSFTTTDSIIRSIAANSTKGRAAA